MEEFKGYKQKAKCKGGSSTTITTSSRHHHQYHHHHHHHLSLTIERKPFIGVDVFWKLNHCFEIAFDKHMGDIRMTKKQWF
jgi:hypothetical protein